MSRLIVAACLISKQGERNQCPSLSRDYIYLRDCHIGVTLTDIEVGGQHQVSCRLEGVGLKSCLDADQLVLKVIQAFGKHQQCTSSEVCAGVINVIATELNDRIDKIRVELRTLPTNVVVHWSRDQEISAFPRLVTAPISNGPVRHPAQLSQRPQY